MSSSELHKPWKLYASHLGSYMRRWIFRHPWGTFRLHNILESDAGRDQHDHPFDFWSLILSGGYIEHRPGCRCTKRRITCKWYGPGSIVRRKAEDLHRLELFQGKPAWTFVISGRYRRMWGFLVKTKKKFPRSKWVPHDQYKRSLYR